MSYLSLEYLKELNDKKNLENESVMSTFRLSVGCRELFYRKNNFNFRILDKMWK
jgi:hypothetical protein